MNRAARRAAAAAVCVWSLACGAPTPTGTVARAAAPQEPDAPAWREARAAPGAQVRRARGRALCTDRPAAAAEAALAACEESDRALAALIGPFAFRGTLGVLWSDAVATPAGTALHDDGAPAAFSRADGLIRLGAGLDAGAPARIRQTCRHETAHQRLWAEGYPRPTGPGAWFDEGLPVWLESLDDAGRCAFAASERCAQARALAAADALPGAAAFAALDAAGLERLVPLKALYVWRHVLYERETPPHYVLAGALAAFVGERLGPRFGDFCRAAAREGAPPRLLAAHGVAPENELDAAFAAWLEGSARGTTARKDSAR